VIGGGVLGDWDSLYFVNCCLLVSSFLARAAAVSKVKLDGLEEGSLFGRVSVFDGEGLGVVFEVEVLPPPAL
jgi:hypothetical protein